MQEALLLCAAGLLTRWRPCSHIQHGAMTGWTVRRGALLTIVGNCRLVWDEATNTRGKSRATALICSGLVIMEHEVSATKRLIGDEMKSRNQFRPG
jgi:hypothetical protein